MSDKNAFNNQGWKILECNFNQIDAQWVPKIEMYYLAIIKKKL